MANETAIYTFGISLRETIALGLDGVTNPAVSHDAPSGASATLNSASGTPVTKVWRDDRQLAGGTDTIALDALARGGTLPALDLTGLKVQVVYIKAAAGNTDTITVAGAASNPYELFGDASGQVTLHPGSQVMLAVTDDLADVSGSVSDITVTSSDVDADYTIMLAAG